MKTIFAICFLIILITFTRGYLAKETLSGKDIFSTVKGSYGSCNTCHPNGASAGRWDSEYLEISADGDKVIPSLKGFGKKKTPEQVEKAVRLFSIKFKVPVKNDQIKALAEYVSSL